MSMGYVDVDSDDDESSSLVVSGCFEDDGSDPAIDYAIMADLAIPAPTKGLEAHARDHEQPLTKGIHVWPGIQAALEETFPGWPDSSDYAAFCRAARAELNKEKHHATRRDVETFAIEVSLTAVDRHVQTFIRSPSNPVGTSLKKLKYYKSALKIMAKGVKYLTAETRQKYEVALGATLTRRGQVFCTESICEKKRKNSAGGSQLSSKLQGKNKRCIWVMTEGEGGAVTWYSHFGKVGSFHHSSFTAGDGIMAAGEWCVERGKCTLINALSGHYKPEPWRFLRALKVLSQNGVITDDTEVQVFGAFYGGTETRLNAREFVNRWTENMEKYKLYP